MKRSSSCYRTVPRTVLPNFRQPRCGTRNLEPRLRISLHCMKKADTAYAVSAFLAQMKRFSSCYRTVPRTVLPNFRQPQCGTRNLEPRLRISLHCMKKADTAYAVSAFLAQMKRFELLKRCSPFTRFPIVLLRPARTHLQVVIFRRF